MAKASVSQGQSIGLLYCRLSDELFGEQDISAVSQTIALGGAGNHSKRLRSTTPLRGGASGGGASSARRIRSSLSGSSNDVLSTFSAYQALYDNNSRI
jgi:hypothetical protein